jgi:hypothetical protein
MQIQQHLSAAIGTSRGADAADSLCTACLAVLDVDAAAISLVFDGANSGTLGASSADARIYDELQFTFGEGPCLASVTRGAPILVSDLAGPGETRWPGYGAAMLAHRIHGVYAMPVLLAGQYVGALDLYRARPSVLDPETLAGALVAAELAELPLLDLIADELQSVVNDEDTDAWAELAALTRVEVGQATGMLMGQLNVEAPEALVRLRAHAYATNRTATEVAKDILDRGLRLEEH